MVGESIQQGMVWVSTWPWWDQGLGVLLVISLVFALWVKVYTARLDRQTARKVESQEAAKIEARRRRAAELAALRAADPAKGPMVAAADRVAEESRVG